MILSSSRTVAVRLRRLYLPSVSSPLFTSRSLRNESTHDSKKNSRANDPRSSNTIHDTTSSPSVKAASHKHPLHPDSESPRRIKVRRRVAGPIKESTAFSPRRNRDLQPTTPSQPLTPSPIDLGRLIVRPRIQKITDGFGQTMLSLPSRIAQQPLKDVSNNSQPSTPSALSLLPSLHASAILDCQQYCKRSANAAPSKSGTEASRRLLRGKKQFLTLVRKLVSRQAMTTTINNNTPQSYRLVDHGVPNQLLQDHVDLASVLLLAESASDNGLSKGHGTRSSHCSIQFMSNMDNNQTAKHMTNPPVRNEPHPVDCMQVRRRHGRTKSTTTSTQTVAVPDMYQDRLQLYLTVMHRIARKLGSVIVHPAVDESETAAATNDCAYPCAPKAWSAVFGFGHDDMSWNSGPREFSALSLPKAMGSGLPTVVVQWTGTNCRVRILGLYASPRAPSNDSEEGDNKTRLRRRRAPLAEPVSLTFDAVF